MTAPGQLSLYEAAVIGAPYQPSSPTSIAAAQAAGRTMGEKKARVLKYLATQPTWGPTQGSTQDELSRALDIARSSICSTVNGLENEGEIVKTGETRPSQYGRKCAVYRLA